MINDDVKQVIHQLKTEPYLLGSTTIETSDYIVVKKIDGVDAYTLRKFIQSLNKHSLL